MTSPTTSSTFVIQIAKLEDIYLVHSSLFITLRVRSSLYSKQYVGMAYGLFIEKTNSLLTILLGLVYSNGHSQLLREEGVVLSPFELDPLICNY